MTITLSQALDYSITEFHYTGDSPCKRTIGKRGAIHERITRVRRNGSTKTWKARPNDFSMPVKYGIRSMDAFRITHESANLYHAPQDCPLNSHANG